MPQPASLYPIPPIAGSSRYTFSGFAGSSDALLIARMFAARRDPQTLLTALCATAVDAQRLALELPYFVPEARVRLLPDWETLPYDTFSPHQDLVSERLATLHELGGGRCDIVVAPAATALYRMPPAAFLAAYTFEFAQGEKLDEARLKAQLTLASYEHVSQVVRPGEYCVRGSLIDLFPMGSALPYRIDLFDDQVDSIRAFDPDTQRSVYPVREVRLLPGREFPFDEPARTRFRSRWREEFEGDPSRSTLYKDIGAGVAPAGIEYYLPMFFDSTATLFDYLPTSTQLIFVGEIDTAIQRFTADTRQRFNFLSRDIERPILPPERLFLGDEEFFARARAFPRLVLKSRAQAAGEMTGGFQPSDTARTRNLELDGPGENGESADTNDANRADASALADQSSAAHSFKNAGSPAASAVPNWSIALPSLTVDRRAEDPVGALRRFIESGAARVLVAAESAGRRETLLHMFSEHGLRAALCESFEDFQTSSAPFALGVAPLVGGFMLPAEQLAIVTENELYGMLARRGSKRRQEQASSVDSMVRDLSELKIGDPIVHTQHGIGRYLGLITMDLGEGETEFLHLEYATESKLYVPVAQLHLISRYSGADPESAPLHALGSGQWEKAKRRAAGQIRDTAAELLNLYARRAARTGHSFELGVRDYETFAESFGFEETPDQAAAIGAVIGDMTDGRPMDRLVCGDVGFGKTEVALRAAFIAVMGGKQVVMLCPTTLLVEQHFQTFTDRFSQWPVRIADLSRFKTGKEINASLKALEDGQIDIVIGTHKLLSPDVRFKRLGLVVIDEEHRFGVRQKEALKALRAEVDVLTLTATPIPRTLGMALEGLRDFSVIATAPQKRLAIKTFVRREEDGVIREAMLRELKRGGQLYFLHNEVETIENRRAMLEELVPEARIAVAHGQMHERDLERVMRDFIGRRANVLLCTTIIETGIDVPTANTILI
ncbi:MAG: transcription-repair coupling factor, partial [Janthinobacterium lividum]